jgi:hypothetical protein
VRSYLGQPDFHEHTSINLKLDVIVTGFRAERKCLLLSIHKIDEISLQCSQVDLYPAGTFVIGRCIKKISNFCIVELPRGVYGGLHKLNNWGRELPEAGQEVS